MIRIKLSPYNCQWQNDFVKIKNQLGDRLKDAAIEHIGSTSIKGLISKPIIDILVGIDQSIKSVP